VVSSTGDGFFVAFDSATNAVESAIAIQQTLDDHGRRTGLALPVRIGLHSDRGTRHGADYSGEAVHIAARVSALAMGGEIVATAETLLEAGNVRTENGRQEALKGVDKPVEVCSIAWQ
jgi:class 3 adenylate cyclase